jgi:hypothetical protein
MSNGAKTTDMTLPAKDCTARAGLGGGGSGW